MKETAASRTNGEKTTVTTDSAVLRYPPGDLVSTLNFFFNKLTFEADCADVAQDIEAGFDGIVVIDARSPDFFTREHVLGSINIPHREMNIQTTAFLPKDKVMVVYCDGIGCNGSTKGAAKLASLGFKVKEMMGGIDWWKRDGHPTEQGEASTNKIVCGC